MIYPRRLMERLTGRYLIKITNPEGFSRILPYYFTFKRAARKHIEKMNQTYPTYKYEIIDNRKGITLK